MAKNSVTLTFLGDSKNLEQTIDKVDAKTRSLSDRFKTFGGNLGKGGGLFAAGSAALAMLGPLGAAGAALGAFSALAVPELTKVQTAMGKTGKAGQKAWAALSPDERTLGGSLKQLSATFKTLQGAIVPLLTAIVGMGARVLKDAAPALKVLAIAGGHVIEAFLKPLGTFVKSVKFDVLIGQFSKFAVIAGNLLGPQLVRLVAVLLTLFVQLMPAGIQILSVLLPLIVTLVDDLTPAIVVTANLVAAVLNWLQATHLLIPALAILGVVILAAGGPVWALGLAVAAIIAGIVELYRNWGKIWGAIKSIIVDVWNWVKGHWPLLVVILAGPMGAAAVFIVKHWATIKNAGIDVWNWIKALPGRIASVFSAIGQAISSPFVYAFNLIRNAWNSTVGGKGFSIPSWVPVIGGDSFRIPYFHTGGIVGGSGEQLAMLRAGEGVFTREQMAAMGGVGGGKVVIEWAGGQADQEFMTWLKKNIRIRGGDPAVLGA